MDDAEAGGASEQPQDAAVALSESSSEDGLDEAFVVPLSEERPPRAKLRLRLRARRAAKAELDLAPRTEDTAATATEQDGSPVEELLLAEPPAEPIEAPPAVAGHELCKRFGEGDSAVDALRDVTIAFERGTFTAIMGPSGSGKSTLLHTLAGLDVPTSGSVELAGVSLTGLGDRELTALRREHVGFVFQTFNLLPTLNAEENVVLPLRIAGSRPNPEWIEMLLEMCGLADRRRHRPAQLSGGEQQRVAIARSLAARPSVIFADEPTGNLDSAAGEEVLALLRRAIDEFERTVVLVTHNPLAAAHAERVAFLADGRLVGDELHPSAATIADALRER
jgi:putative ABC transport system ATP-binding protein